MSVPVRVRFAPSPTGMLHIGGVRSALFNWIWARHTSGVFILRIEDTDRARYVPDAVDQITASLDWLGLTPDEGPIQGGNYGPYVQSERLELYRHYAEQLLASGALYPCWCTTERLDSLRQAAQKAGTAFAYDRHCLKHPQALTEPHVLRYKVPANPSVVAWDDEVRGKLEFKTADIDDFVALKSDGYPTYHLANVVDDHLMEISHVLRAEEWIPSTPKHLLLFAAFGWEAPHYAHLPQVLGSDKAKLSKRHSAKSALEYRDEGYLPDTIINFLAALGWNEGSGSTKEIYSRQELIQAFSLERIQKSPAVFESDRLDWLNGKYIRELPIDELLPILEPFWPKAAGAFDDAYRGEAFALIQERIKHLDELPDLTDFFFTDPDQKLVKATLPLDKVEQATATSWLQSAIDIIEKSTVGFEAAALEKLFRDDYLTTIAVEKPGPVFMVLRVAITGKTATPGLFETMAVLGQKTVVKRLQNAIFVLK